jgi:D-alanine--poly(phosphoribitol) ligase subunit 1
VLSPGYLGMPETTRERFVECDIDGVRERLYRTGDRGYFLEDGNVVFQGRLDDQVKINGFRIELGEISHGIDRHRAVKQNYVTVTENAAGEKSLLAFVVPAHEDCTAEDVRRSLMVILPGYMIPAEIHICESLPLTATGKVDRRALLCLHQSLHQRSGAVSS